MSSIGLGQAGITSHCPPHSSAIMPLPRRRDMQLPTIHHGCAEDRTCLVLQCSVLDCATIFAASSPWPCHQTRHPLPFPVPLWAWGPYWVPQRNLLLWQAGPAAACDSAVAGLAVLCDLVVLSAHLAHCCGSEQLYRPHTDLQMFTRPMQRQHKMRTQLQRWDTGASGTWRMSNVTSASL